MVLLAALALPLLWLADLRAVVDGRLKASDTVEEMAAALRSHVADIRAEVLEPEPDVGVNEPHVRVTVSARVGEGPVPQTVMAVPADRPHGHGWFLGRHVGNLESSIGFYAERPGGEPWCIAAGADNTSTQRAPASRDR